MYNEPIMDMSNIWDKMTPWLLDHGIKILGLLIGAFIFHLIVKAAIERLVRQLVRQHEGISKEAEEKRENTLIRILHGTVQVILIIFIVMMILSEFGIDIGPLIAGAGVVGIAVGFGGQYLIRDIITGLFIIIENQYRVGDAVTISGISGKVEDISLRLTKLRDLDGVAHYIPHGEVTTVSNMTSTLARINVNVGVSYSADLNKTRDVINKVGEELAADEEWGTKIIEAPAFLRVDDLADSAVVIKVVGDTVPGEQWAVAGEFRKRVKEGLDAAGIEIPFPQIVVHNAK